MFLREFLTFVPEEQNVTFKNTAVMSKLYDFLFDDEETRIENLENITRY